MSHPTLPYAPAPRGTIAWLHRHRRLLIGLGVALIFLSLLMYANRFWLAEFQIQLQHLRNQSRLSHQVLPPGTVIFTEDPARIDALSSDLTYRRPLFTDAAVPHTLVRFYATDELYAHVSPGGRVGSFQVNDTFGFLRTSSRGLRWIVHLDGADTFMLSAGNRFVLMRQNSFTPANWIPGNRGTWASSLSKVIHLAPNDHITLFAPQPDPTSASRITLPYELNNLPGLLIGTLEDNGHVDFTVASGPATLVPWNAP